MRLCLPRGVLFNFQPMHLLEFFSRQTLLTQQNSNCNALKDFKK